MLPRTAFSAAARLAIVAILLLSSASAQSVGDSANKPFITHLVVATTWPTGYSEIWFVDSPVSFQAVSNIDFQVFGPAFIIETRDAVHDFIILGFSLTRGDVIAEQQAGNADARGLPRYWPQQLPPPAGVAQYVQLPNSSGAIARANDLRVLDAIHQYYQANRVVLDAAARQRAIDAQRIAAEEAARKAAMPPHVGPPVTFKRIEYATPVPSPR
jgi:hypothetical protein